MKWSQLLKTNWRMSSCVCLTLAAGVAVFWLRLHGSLHVWDDHKGEQLYEEWLQEMILLSTRTDPLDPNCVSRFSFVISLVKNCEGFSNYFLSCIVVDDWPGFDSPWWLLLQRFMEHPRLYRRGGSAGGFRPLVSCLIYLSESHI